MLPAMTINANKAVNAATPISTERWVGPVAPCEFWVIYLSSACERAPAGGGPAGEVAIAASILGKEAGGFHQLFVPLFLFGDPVRVVGPGHE
jgi:hypothetical protein